MNKKLIAAVAVSFLIFSASSVKAASLKDATAYFAYLPQNKISV